MRLHGGRADGDAALALDRRKVGGGRAIMDFADAMDLAGFLQQALGERGLAGVDVGNDAEVAPKVLGLGVHKKGSRCCQHQGAARRRWLTGVRPGLGLGDLVHGTFSFMRGCCETLKRKKRPMGALSGVLR